MASLSAVGIDLGTTYSAVAILGDRGIPVLLPNAESERLTPSAVLFDEDTIVVGQVAKDAAGAHPNNVVLFVKLEMGNPSWHVLHQGQRFSPVDISALILKKLKQDAELYLRRNLPHAVITVPAFFEDEHRRATIAAGEIAGFRVLDLINEPTAAAIAYGVDHDDRDETVLVYDLGGGTFDVTIMRIEAKQFRSLASVGDPRLGGKDFDDALIGFAAETFLRDHGVDPTSDPSDAWDVRSQAERAKRELSKRNKTVMMVRAQGRTSRIEVGRDQFEGMIRPKVDTTLACVRNALRSASLAPDKIDRVLLVGGSTRIPSVQSRLREFFGKSPDVSVNPDEAVALGAALLAAKKLAEGGTEPVPTPVAEKVGGLQITDVTSHSIGIEAHVPGTSQRINSILIPRNSPLPCEVAKEFITVIPGQSAIKVTIYQGEFKDPALCNPVGEFTLGGLPPNRQADRRVRVTVSCGANNVVNVTALDIESGKETTTTVSYIVGQTSEQVSARKRWMDSHPVA